MSYRELWNKIRGYLWMLTHSSVQLGNRYLGTVKSTFDGTVALATVSFHRNEHDLMCTNLDVITVCKNYEDPLTIVLKQSKCVSS